MRHKAAPGAFNPGPLPEPSRRLAGNNPVHGADDQAIAPVETRTRPLTYKETPTSLPTLRASNKHPDRGGASSRGVCVMSLPLRILLEDLLARPDRRC